MVVEALEERLLLSADLPVITSFVADNRGLVELGVSADLLPSTVNDQTVKVFTAGADGLLGTADDKFVSSAVSYDGVNHVITANADVAPDDRYRVEVDGNQVLGANGKKLDAEFNGPDQNTGDGVEGGKLEFFTRTGATAIVRFTTIAGNIDVQLYLQDTPLTVQNFFDYMNSGVWDDTFFHRLVSNFVIQGGGFEANTSFSRIPTNPPVQNEPGISNVRGTIAMAKLGNDPNSATNQWFFNLGDNSANLDNQNGGFTVFGEITDSTGLGVLDDLASFETVDATAQNGAFSDLPVKNKMLVDDRNGIVVPTDLIRISRIARLYDISAEPFSQLPTTGLQQIISPNGGAKVTIFSLNGVLLGNASDFLKVRFAGDTQVSSIRITGHIPAPIGIQITGAHVGSIVDRGGAGDNLRFIVSDQSIGNVSIKGTMVGENLNGVLLANGVLMPDDIDGDGIGNDPAAVVVRDGSVRGLKVGGDVRGSIVASQGVLSMNIRGQAQNADMVLGAAQDFASSTTFRFGSVHNSSLQTMTPLRTLKTGQWTGAGEIQAPAIQRLAVGGGRDTSGDIEVGLTLSGASGATRTLGSAVIRGVAVRSTWDIGGDAGPIRIRGGTGNWTLNVSGDSTGLQTGPVVTSSVDVSGMMTRLRATEWLGGEINANGLISLQIAGNRTDSGDLFADMQIGSALTTHAWVVTGDIHDSTIRFVGDLRNLKLRGDVNTSDIDIGSIPRLQLNSVHDSTIRIRRAAHSITAKDWIGGRLQTAGVGSVLITGDRGGANGDFLADLQAGQIQVFSVAGNLQGTASFQVLGRFTVDGDVMDSTVTFTQRDILNPAVEHIMVGGSLMNSDLDVQGTSGPISVGAMFDSQISAGTFQMIGFGFPASGGSFNSFFRTDSVTVRGLGIGQVSMSNSYILGARIGTVRIVNPDLGALPAPYGVAALELDRVEMVFTDGTAMGLVKPTSASVTSALEVRPGFMPPAT